MGGGAKPRVSIERSICFGRNPTKTDVACSTKMLQCVPSLQTFAASAPMLHCTWWLLQQEYQEQLRGSYYAR